jgi:hypothetical protein
VQGENPEVQGRIKSTRDSENVDKYNLIIFRIKGELTF